ncbi:MAG: hypothetical protein KC731_28790 [Myxococcales bacterium]|nr:hypothetical protein [Myxococcales bacterium]
MVLRRFLPLASLLLVLGCEEGTACHDHAECTKDARCYCDAQGQLFREKRDANGDGRTDEIRFYRDAAQRVIRVTSDWGDNGSIEREVTYTYDTDGRRVTQAGWLLQCDDNKFRWTCSYEEPCAAPYDACKPCKKEYDFLRPDGSVKPCGKPSAKSTAK